MASTRPSHRGAHRAGGGVSRLLAVVTAVGVLACVLVATALLLVLGGQQHGPTGADNASGATSGSTRGSDSGARDDVTAERLVDALAVLRRWDDRRAAAWTDGDVAALRALYVPGSVAGRRDAALLRGWRRQGVLPAAVGTQVLGARLVARRPGVLRLLVTDRVVVTVGTRPARRDAPSTRLVVMRRADAAGAARSAWRVSAVYARPAATTSPTPRSENS